MKRLLTVLLFVLSCHRLWAQETKLTQDQTDVYNTLVRIGQAWSKNNLDTLDKYIDNEYLHTDIRKEKGVSNPSLEFSNVEINFYNGLAIANGINVFTGPGNTENSSAVNKTELRFTQVLRKEGTIWKRLRFQATVVAKK